MLNVLRRKKEAFDGIIKKRLYGKYTYEYVSLLEVIGSDKVQLYCI